MIINPIVCDDCNRELQPGDLRVAFDNDDLIRICGFCGHEVNVDEKRREIKGERK